MRKSKSRKSELKQVRLNASKNKRRLKEEKKKAKAERDAKYQAWLNLPEEEWTDARKKANNKEVNND
ncbi:MAG: hypothetical protein HWN81_00145 [Candidatus Lokiarchaeota archaeon]|nr:hypothetical protein [Candidatus Lokiarchaeota archaeon]